MKHAPRLTLAWAGVTKALAPAFGALSAQLLLRVWLPAAPFAPYSAGARLVRVIPGPMATQAIERLGHSALNLLEAAAVLATFVAAALLRKLPTLRLAGCAFLVAMLTAVADPLRPGLIDSLLAALAAACGVGASRILVNFREIPERGFDPSRRRLLRGSVLFVATGATLASFGKHLATSKDTDGFEAKTAVAIRDDPAFAEVPGLSARVTPAASHYVVDINLDRPYVAADSWHLRVAGEVAHPMRLSYERLASLATVEQVVVMECISNPVGGGLIGNAIWTGVPLAEVLALVQPVAAAPWIHARAADGYTETISVEEARRPGVMLALAMDRRRLPRDHGSPLRLLYPGRYGMRSIKWLTELQVSSAPNEGYWEKRGWDNEAVMKTGSRFDLPRTGSRVTSPFTVAGLAWASTGGISKVEVSPDDGASWIPAQLEEAISDISWRRWQTRIYAAPGLHPLLVRATDGGGQAQRAESASPHPSGASGYHRVVITVL